MTPKIQSCLYHPARSVSRLARLTALVTPLIRRARRSGLPASSISTRNNRKPLLDRSARLRSRQSIPRKRSSGIIAWIRSTGLFWDLEEPGTTDQLELLEVSISGSVTGFILAIGVFELDSKTPSAFLSYFPFAFLACPQVR